MAVTGLCAALIAGAALFAAPAKAQVELIDPDAKDIVKKEPARPPPPPQKAQPVARPRGGGVSWDQPTGDTEPDTTDTGDEPELVPVKKPVRKTPERGGPDAGTKDGGVELKDARKDGRPAPPQIVIAARTDAELETAWRAWKTANEGGNVKAEQGARAELVRLKLETGADDLQSWAIGLLRASQVHEANGDSGGAIEIALGAVDVAPGLPASWWGLATAYFRADPTEPGRIVTAAKQALVRQLSDPRYARPVLADVSVISILAIIGTAMLVVGVLFLRRSWYFLFDFHFFFPRAAARWQTSALAIIVLLLPIVFRMGIAPALLTLFAAGCLYLSLTERIVGAVLISLLGLVPLLGGALVEATAFAGTPAERLYLVDRGGPGAEPIAQDLARQAADERASFEELFVLGRFELRRGKIDQAITHLKAALNLKPNDPEAQTNLGAAMFLAGDLENSRGLFEAASKADPPIAAAFYNLGRLHQRRAGLYGDSAASEVDEGAAALAQARTLDPAITVADFSTRQSVMANELVRSVPLPIDELLASAVAPDAAAQVRSQLSLIVLGDVSQPVASLYPFLMALALVGLGGLARSVDASRACAKCGRPVSRRADPDVSPGSPMCTQCVNVFAKKNLVAPSLKVRKQLEVARYQSRLGRICYVLGALVSGLGHVFAGWPVRGTIYAFVFVGVVVAFVLRNGVLRVPYEPMPVLLRLAPLALVFALVYLLSLRGLRKRQG